MRRKPRSLFKARHRVGGPYVGPEFAGPEPRYLSLLDELAVRHGHQIEPGKAYQVVIAHDDGCAFFSGGPCDCEPEASLIEGM